MNPSEYNRRSSGLFRVLQATVTHRVAGIGLLCAMGVAGYVLYHWHPSSISIMPQCPTKSVLGLECPGCGSTRAVHLLLHCDVRMAFRHNPLLVLLGLPTLIVLAVDLLATSICARRVTLSLGPRFGVIIAALLLAYMVARNIPLAPFDLLRPPTTSPFCPDNSSQRTNLSMKKVA